MADENRTALDSLGWLRALAAAPHASDFHQALRRVEVAFRSLPRWGEAVRPRDEPVRLGQDPSLAFAPAAVSDFEAPSEQAPGRLSVAFFGLFGPHGPLPLHLTEYARDRIRHAGDFTFSAFANLFHHRLLVLFHRAWAHSRPVVSRDRRSADRFLTYVGATFGLGLGASRGLDAVPDRAKLYLAGLLAAGARNPAGLRALIHSYFGVPIQVQEFVGEWLELAADDRFRLGHSVQVSSLGRTTVIGRRVYSRSSKFRVIMGPLAERDLKRFLPGSQGLERLTALVDAYAGQALTWDLELVPAANTATQLRLGREGRLGFNALLGSARSLQKQPHVFVDPFSNQTKRSLG